MLLRVANVLRLTSTGTMGSQESADDIIAALDTLELGSYAVLGESLKGAHQAAWTAVKRRQSVWALCLISPCTFVW